MESLKARKLTLRELRIEIEEVIKKLEGIADAEAEINISSCKAINKLQCHF